MAHLQGRDLNFWDFGHLLWRPTGAIAYRLLDPIARARVDGTAQVQVTWLLTAIASAFGLLAVIAAFGWLKALRRSDTAALFGAATILVTQTFLDHAQAGTPYVPALATTLLALWLLAFAGRYDGTPGRSIALPAIAGLSLAVSVGLWLPMVLAGPAVVLSPLFLSVDGRARRRLSVYATLGGTVAFAILLAVAVRERGIHDISALRAWTMSTAHGIANVSGVSRAALGFGRSIVNVGEVGLQAKRFLVHDPLNPVTFAALWGSALWKIALVYVFGLGVTWLAIGAHRTRGEVAFLTVATLPTAAFAIFWQGGDMERYLPLFPALILIVALAVSQSGGRWLTLTCIGGFLVFVAGVNVRALSTAVVGGRCDAEGARVIPLLSRLRPHDLVATSYSHDDAIWYTRDCPFHAGNLQHHLEIYPAVVPGTADVAQWRRRFAVRALAAWDSGGHVWIARRALRARPDRDWLWTEGEEPAVRWSDFPAFFSTLQLSDSVGGADGFVQLARSPANLETLTTAAGTR